MSGHLKIKTRLTQIEGEDAWLTEVDVFPYSLDDLRHDRPQVSFPKTIPDAIAAEYKVHPYTVEDEPDWQAGKVAEQNAAPDLIKGKWVLGWTQRDMTADELAEWRDGQTVDAWKAKAIMHQMGYLEAAEAAVAVAGGVTKLAWDNASTFTRSSSAIGSLSVGIGIDPLDLDAMFVAAAEIVV